MTRGDDTRAGAGWDPWSDPRADAVPADRGTGHTPAPARRRWAAVVLGCGLVLLLLASAAAIARWAVRDPPPAAAIQPGESASPSAPVTAATSATPPTRPASSPPPPAAPARYVFPVLGNASYARSHHDYPATDIIAACGNDIVAVTDGVVLDAVTVDAYDPTVNDGATRGGLSVSILGDDGVRYYGSHYESINADVQPGARVTAGQKLGEVGRTGNASACHLHFGISPPCARVGDWWVQRGVVWPWPFLDAWRRNQTSSPAADVAEWHADHGCPASP